MTLSLSKSAALLLAVAAVALSAEAAPKAPKRPDPVAADSALAAINTFVGTAPSETRTSGKFGKNTEEFGQMMPAVLIPNGMTFWTPQTRDTERKCVAPYYYADSLLQGFRGSHWLVGGCTQDYGSLTLMPLYGSLRCSPESRSVAFDHAREVSTPYNYAVDLPSEGIRAEMTATERCGAFRFRYDRPGRAYIVINPNSDEAQGYVRVDTVRNAVYGFNPVHRIYQGKGLPAGFAGYFVIKFKNKISAYGCFAENTPIVGRDRMYAKPEMGCYVEFDLRHPSPGGLGGAPNEGLQVDLSIGTSFTDFAHAEANLEAEIGERSFEEVEDYARRAWLDRLLPIRVETDDRQALDKFYSALYRASFLPRLMSDRDGSHPAFSTGQPAKPRTSDKGQRTAEADVNGLPLPGPLCPALSSPDTLSLVTCTSDLYYDDFSMWDTYRALHPLYNLVYPQLSASLMASLLTKYREGGWLPIFPCWNSYTAAMIGDHCIAALCEAILKGIDVDAETAYEAMRRNAFEVPSDIEYADGLGRRALASYLRYGYIPVEDSVPYAYHKREQVSRTLEYAYDDYALAQVARMLGKTADYNLLMERSRNYANVINPRTGYADARTADGRFLSIDPFTFSKNITEGAPCHYTWYVPHDPEGLMALMGGREAYVAKLDSMFTEGRYWHGNEPCHQIPFMYNYAGEPWKTSERVRHIMDTEYLDCAGGLSGNEDAGQMAAWYIFAALGFYPVCPASDLYAISGPTFKYAEITPPGGNTIRIEAPNASPENIYVKSVTYNGAPYSTTFIRHSDLLRGGTWHFEMVNH